MRLINILDLLLRVNTNIERLSNEVKYMENNTREITTSNKQEDLLTKLNTILNERFGNNNHDLSLLIDELLDFGRLREGLVGALYCRDDLDIWTIEHEGSLYRVAGYRLNLSHDDIDNVNKFVNFTKSFKDIMASTVNDLIWSSNILQCIKHNNWIFVEYTENNYISDFVIGTTLNEINSKSMEEPDLFLNTLRKLSYLKHLVNYIVEGSRLYSNGTLKLVE